jgi:hypothetical protein
MVSWRWRRVARSFDGNLARVDGGGGGASVASGRSPGTEAEGSACGKSTSGWFWLSPERFLLTFYPRQIGSNEINRLDAVGSVDYGLIDAA